jgi:putative membrane protein
MLIMLSAPQAALLRGLPNWLRRGAVAPLLAGSGVRALGLLARPLPATLLFIATTYFWMVPRYHDVAILDEPIHYLWHATLLLSGLAFFWRVLDPRPYPLGASLGTRLAMFWFASLGNIVLGFYLAFKHRLLYRAYGEMGRLWGVSPIEDERLGGLLMWVLGGMMFAAAAMLMVHRWASQEESAAARRERQSAALDAASSAAKQRAQNRATAIGLLAFAAGVLLLTFAAAMSYRYAGLRPGR